MLTSGEVKISLRITFSRLIGHHGIFILEYDYVVKKIGWQTNDDDDVHFDYK